MMGICKHSAGMVTRRISVVSILAIGCCLMIPSSSSAFQFREFTSVENVCPDECDQRPSDVLHLKDGRKVRGRVIANNHEFFVVNRLHEIRAVPLEKVKNIDWHDGQPEDLTDYDQILLKSGHVLSGKITGGDKNPTYLEIEGQLTDNTYTVFESQIEEVYR